MECTHHPFSELFAQLGLPSEETDIRAFIDAHRPLPDGMTLSEAPFWTPAQAELIRQQWKQDADWAEVVDQLNLALH